MSIINVFITTQYCHTVWSIKYIQKVTVTQRVTKTSNGKIIYQQKSGRPLSQLGIKSPLNKSESNNQQFFVGKR